MYLDMGLLALMLKNYKRLYIMHEREVDIDESVIQQVVKSDIDIAIEWAESRAIAEEEVRMQFK